MTAFIEIVAVVGMLAPRRPRNHLLSEEERRPEQETKNHQHLRREAVVRRGSEANSEVDGDLDLEVGVGVLLLDGRAEHLDDRDDYAGDEDEEQDVLGRACAIFVAVEALQDVHQPVHLLLLRRLASSDTS